MKRAINIYFIFTLTLLVLVIQSCKEDNPIEPPSSQETIVSPNAKVISDSVYQLNIITVSVDSSNWTFKKGNATIDGLKQGDFLISNEGKGILRKINTVQSLSDRVVLGTTQAALTDVIQQCSIEFSTPIKSLKVNKEKFLLDGVRLQKNNGPYEFFYEFNEVVIYDDDNNPSTTNDQILLNGNVGISPFYNLSLSIHNWQLTEMDISYNFQENVEISCEVKLPFWDTDKVTTLASYELTPITFFIGVIPVVVTPELDFDIGINGEIYASLNITKVTQNAEFSVGIAFANGHWTPYANESHNFSAEPVSFSANADLKAYVGPQLNMLIYGLAGPYARIGLFGKLEIEAFPNPKAELYSGIELAAGIKLEVFDHNISNQEFPLILQVRSKVWEQNNLTGKITGLVKDAVTGVPISNAKIVCYKNNLPIDSAYSISDGTFQISIVPFNDYKVVISKQGYINSDYSNVIVEMFRTTTLETVLQIDQSYNGSGNVEGYILDALTGNGIYDVNIKTRSGINNRTGNVIQSTQTNTSGYYIINSLSAGNYTIEVSKTNYLTTYFTVVCLGGTTNSNQNGVISPIIPIGETRIVLTWGDNPNDLDSHLTGPLNDGTRFHIYYIHSGQNSLWPTIVNLDRDDVDSYGPETTTLYQQINGVYRFSVHDFTNRNDFNSYALSQSGAQVRVYKNTGLVANFIVPPNILGNLWTVFEMSGPNIIPINTFSNISSPGDITSPIRINEELNSFPEK
jgi:hypothetical protein